MRIPKKNYQLISKSEIEVKKPQKVNTNAQKNSTVYFQIGLIAVLLAIYGLFEMKFETKKLPEIAVIYTDPNLTFIDIIQIAEKTPEAITAEVNKQRNRLSVDPVIVPNEISINDLPKEFSSQTSQPNKSFNPKDIILVDKPEEPDVSFDRVEHVPIYPGCENKKTDDDKRKCMSDKINKLVQKNFDGNIASDYGLTGIQRISVEFKIDKTGHVTDIKTRAPHFKLQEEAERIINKIPDMQPGMQRDKPVGVVYSLPIVFKVQN